MAGRAANGKKDMCVVCVGMSETFRPTVAKKFKFPKLMHNNEASDSLLLPFLFCFVCLFREKSLISLSYLYAGFNNLVGLAQSAHQ